MWDLRQAEQWIQEHVDRGVQRGMQQGRLAAMRPMVHQFERRLRRPLTEAEQATLLARLDTHGADRLGDVVLDLDPDALDRWLGDPDAR